MTRMTAACALAAACLAMSPRPARAEQSISSFGHYQGYSAPLYPDQIKSSFYLPMRDGVRLAVDLYLPGVGGKTAPGQFPVVWHHSFERRAVTSPMVNGPTRRPS